MRNPKRNNFSAKRKQNKKNYDQISFYMKNNWGNDDIIPDYSNQFFNPSAHMPGNHFNVELSKQ